MGPNLAFGASLPISQPTPAVKPFALDPGLVGPQVADADNIGALPPASTFAGLTAQVGSPTAWAAVAPAMEAANAQAAP